MVFKAELNDVNLIKQSFEAISNIVDEVVCNVDSEGFRVSAIDRSHITFVTLDLQSTLFDEYVCDVPEKICIDTMEFMKILKRSKKNDTLVLGLDGSNLSITFIGDVTRNFKIRLIDIDYESPQPPKIQTPNNIILPSQLMKDTITDMELFSEKLYFIIDEDYFRASCDSEFGDAEVKYLHGVNVSEVSKSCFSIDKLKDMFRASKFSNEVELGLGNEMPIILKFNLDTGDGGLSFLLAPRIETDE